MAVSFWSHEARKSLGPLVWRVLLHFLLVGVNLKWLTSSIFFPPHHLVQASSNYSEICTARFVRRHRSPIKRQQNCSTRSKYFHHITIINSAVLLCLARWHHVVQGSVCQQPMYIQCFIVSPHSPPYMPRWCSFDSHRNATTLARRAAAPYFG
jgi:hypothetical protein